MSDPFQLIYGDCLTELPAITGIDACVCDPPYGLKFMGKGWDHGIPGVPYWQAVLAACKPGAHLLAFGGTRTFHRLACAIEDAGWEMRDTLMWVYGSGFPKSHNLDGDWEGWGTALKPAWEPIIMARKPIEGTVAQNIQKHGCGALNIDGCRVEVQDGDIRSGGFGQGNRPFVEGEVGCNTIKKGRPKRVCHGDDRPSGICGGGMAGSHADGETTEGRWPANLLHDGSEEVVSLFPSSAGASAPVRGDEPSANHKSCYSQRDRVPGTFFGDQGSAARFFYCAKASRSDRDEGCESLEVQHVTCRPDSDDEDDRTIQERLHGRKARNFHPTVKPTPLMRYLCRLVTPPGGTVLDPFMGSGSTGKAAILEGFKFIGIENELDYLPIALARIQYAVKPQQQLL